MCKNSEDLVMTSAAMEAVEEQIELIAKRPTAVLLTGETGVGKTRIAKVIHEKSLRRERDFLTLNCAATAGNIIESELFGHIKGAFTGADDDRKGFFQKANRGTLFIDEIGKLSLAMQMKFLRALEEGEITPMGSTTTLKVNVRVIAATNRDLEALVEKEEFMLDLYFRLNVFPIDIPPLRERREEIPELVKHFIDQIRKEFKAENELLPKEKEPIAKNIKPTSDAEDYLKSKKHPWQGNLRELKNKIESALVRVKDDNELTRTHFLESKSLFDTLLSERGVTWENIKNAYREASEKDQGRGPRNSDRFKRTLSALLDLDEKRRLKREELDNMKRKQWKAKGYVGIGSINNFAKICMSLFFPESDKDPTTANFISEARTTLKGPEPNKADESSRNENSNEPPA